MSRHGSPRSIPTSNRHQLVRAVSQMDMATAAKLGQQSNFAGLSMLTPLQTYTPHIVDEYYTDYSSPEPPMGIFAPHPTKTNFVASGRLTPQTPEPYNFNEPLAIADNFDQYNHQFAEDGPMQIGLGFDSEVSSMLLPGSDMRIWTPELDTVPNSMAPMPSFHPSAAQSPASMNSWTEQAISVSPPHLPHTRGVPSLSISESSAPELESADGVQEEWSNLRMEQTQSLPMYMDTVRVNPKHPQWEDLVMPRRSHCTPSLCIRTYIT
jgi:hypothetical protein